MYKKIIITTALIAFAAIQLVNSLQCYRCDTPVGCDSASKVTCNNAQVDHTIAEASKFFYTYKNTTSTDFSCAYLQMNDAFFNLSTGEIRGCVYYEQFGKEPTFTILPDGPLNVVYYQECTTDLCNGRNPAAAITLSNALIIPAVLSVVLAKFLVS